MEELTSSGTALSFKFNKCFAAFSTGTSTVFDGSMALGECGFSMSVDDGDGLASSFAMFVDSVGDSFVVISSSTSVVFSVVDEKGVALPVGGVVDVGLVAEIALAALFPLLVALSFELFIMGVCVASDACSFEVAIVVFLLFLS